MLSMQQYHLTMRQHIRSAVTRSKLDCLGKTTAMNKCRHRNCINSALQNALDCNNKATSQHNSTITNITTPKKVTTNMICH